MARTFTFEELYDRFAEMADIEGDTHVGAAERRKAINSGVSDTWDKICSNGLGEKYVKKVSFNTTAGTSEYAFSTICTDGDFYRVHQLYVVEGTQLRPLPRVQPAEIAPFKAPTSTVAMKLYYLPCAPEPDPTNEATWEAQTFDGINGWEEHALIVAIGHVKRKKDDSYSPFAQRKRELEERMATLGQVDFGEPMRVVQKSKRMNPYRLFQNNVSAYVVRSDKLELYYYEGYVI